MTKKAKAAPITGAVIKPVRIGALTVPTITVDATGLDVGQVIQFIPANGVTYTGKVESIVGDQVFFSDGVKPV